MKIPICYLVIVKPKLRIVMVVAVAVFFDLKLGDEEERKKFLIQKKNVLLFIL